jgi:hypothetical protein
MKAAEIIDRLKENSPARAGGKPRRRDRSEPAVAGRPLHGRRIWVLDLEPNDRAPRLAQPRFAGAAGGSIAVKTAIY